MCVLESLGGKLKHTFSVHVHVLCSKCVFKYVFMVMLCDYIYDYSCMLIFYMIMMILSNFLNV